MLKAIPLSNPLQVKANGLIVFVPKYGIEGPVFLTPRDDSAKQQQQQGAAAGKAKSKGAAAVVRAVAAADGGGAERVLDEEAQTVTSKWGLLLYWGRGRKAGEGG